MGPIRSFGAVRVRVLFKISTVFSTCNTEITAPRLASLVSTRSRNRTDNREPRSERQMHKSTTKGRWSLSRVWYRYVACTPRMADPNGRLA